MLIEDRTRTQKETLLPEQVAAGLLLSHMLLEEAYQALQPRWWHRFWPGHRAERTYHLVKAAWYAQATAVDAQALEVTLRGEGAS